MRPEHIAAATSSTVRPVTWVADASYTDMASYMYEGQPACMASLVCFLRNALYASEVARAVFAIFASDRWWLDEP